MTRLIEIIFIFPIIIACMFYFQSDGVNSVYVFTLLLNLGMKPQFALNKLIFCCNWPLKYLYQYVFVMILIDIST